MRSEISNTKREKNKKAQEKKSNLYSWEIGWLVTFLFEIASILIINTNNFTQLNASVVDLYGIEINGFLMPFLSCHKQRMIASVGVQVKF